MSFFIQKMTFHHFSSYFSFSELLAIYITENMAEAERKLKQNVFTVKQVHIMS